MFLAEHGDEGTATALLSRAMRLDEAPRARVASALSRLLAGLSPKVWHRQLDADLCACLAEPSVDPQGLASVAAATLLAKQPLFDGAAATLEAMGRDPLWLAFLSGCLNVSPAMEARLNAVRAALVSASDIDGEGCRALICALALSGFASEYAAPLLEAPGDRALLFRPPSVAEALALGDGAMQALLRRRAVEEPAREHILAQGAPALTPDDADSVSKAVRAQYEANPYPRWTAPPAPAPRAMRDVITGLPGLDRQGFGGRVDTVLVAGCGTGFEPIDMARMDPSLAITAVDLSLSSLAHGMRIAQDLDLHTVKFVRGDILALDRIADRFDLITSTGVIHHMARPDDGLGQLVKVLRPGGVVRLGLYSERARALVRAAHDLIRERGWTTADADIRAFRAHLLALADTAPLAALRHSADFYSLSGCRDLVFHVQEHRYTPPQLGELVVGAGLRLIGLDAPPEASKAFERAFGASDPLDMALWDRLESRQPTMFAGMYHLWAQKPA